MKLPFCSNRISITTLGIRDMSPLLSCQGGSIFGPQSVLAVMRRSEPEEHKKIVEGICNIYERDVEGTCICQMEEKI